MSECWYPENHTYTGECEGQLVLPHYPNVLHPLRIFDTAVKSMRWARWQKKAWRASRAKSLYRWGFSDIMLDIREGGIDGTYQPGGITLRVQDVDPNSSNNYGGFGLAPLEPAYSGEYDALTWDAAKGYVQIHPKTAANAFLGRNYSLLTAAMCHEFGHAFGFGHGGTGIMRSALLPPYQPSAEEIAAFRSYWGLTA